VTGSVASIEVPALARELMREGAEVYPVMSEASEKLVRPDTLEWATGNPVVRKLTGKTEHVRLAGNWKGKADLVLVAPCTANTISKIALGIDDTPVTTMASMALGGKIPLVICPAAHEPMYRNPAVESNTARLKDLGVEFVGPRFEEGKAKMATVEEIVGAVVRSLSPKDLQGKKVVVAGGSTVEYIDPVRVITNLSSGRTGVALVKEAWRRGADVSYVFGGYFMPPEYIRSRRVRTTREMRDAVLSEIGKEGSEVFITAAAPSDFAPQKPARKKIPTAGGSFEIRLVPTPKIVREVRKKWPGLYIVAFKAETAGSQEDLGRAAAKFMKETGVNMVVANDVSGGKGFGSESNTVLMLGGGPKKLLREQSKDLIAMAILDRVARNL
jgi:phosphopantothenoylcysteine decarboxylase/phosphopantothenate--cysteine ligase